MRQQLAGLVVIGAITVGLYGPGLRAPFVYEDLHWAQTLADPVAWTWIPSRVLTLWSYSWTWRLVGDDPTLYRITNLAIHLLTTGGVWIIARSLAPTVTGGALVSAALFAWHPLQTEAVAYVTGRADLLVTLWSVLAVIVVLTLGGWLRWGLLLVLMALAVWSKESGLLLIGLVGLTWFTRERDCWTTWHTWGWLAGGALVAGVGVWRAATAGVMGTGSPAFQWVAWWSYLGALFWPTALSVDHDWVALGPWLLGCAAAGSLALPAFAWWCYRDEFPWVGWGVLWAVGLVWARMVMRAEELFTEHHFYGAMPALCLGLGIGMMAVWHRVNQYIQRSEAWRTQREA